MITFALVDADVSQYENFVETWIYVNVPVIGSSCWMTGYSATASTIKRQVPDGELVRIIY